MNVIQKGFSLVELLVVVAIIGVLAGVGTVGYQSYVEASKVKAFEQNVRTIVKAIDFEYLVVKNRLGSALDEVDSSNMLTGGKIDADSTCETFNFTIKKHFEHFENPWNRTKKMITVDTQGQAGHKQGQVQITCQRSQGFLNGWNCKIQDSLFHIIAYYRDGSEQAGAGAVDTSNELGGTRQAGSTVYSKWYNRGYTNPPDADRSTLGQPYMTTSAGTALCGSSGYTRGAIAISTDANY
ncbi:type II secretion system protein [Candidatus Pelagibacter sp. HIMB1321]|uniref:type II secretion system protein n=1 Tax=Candidatus Pelagibacter sp. HIMB1321 TaxID=1388755 RepID=UPI000A07DF99|nr:prepilin-type N-terminal cleavage/methylation domain-containing protein [Candidatus Pelagibacter sp. HIMB1321]SMF77327.1 prepilin-type N-terminal cleavage/methylation domain-containing protein [Candidatus Pelagibacter sp. HIMB1321]